jgi:lipopolysaccharide export system permease protein
MPAQASREARRTLPGRHRGVEFTSTPSRYNPFYRTGFSSVTSPAGRLRLVTRYILREHVGPLAFSVATLTSLLLLNYISKRFEDLVGKGLPWNVIAEFFVLSVPFTIAMTLPMAVLIATLYAFSRLASDSELTAMMSCGVGTRQLLTPVLGAGLALSLLMVAFNDQLLPRANYRLNGLMATINQKKPTFALKPQTLNEVTDGQVYMWLARLDRSRNMMYDVTIYDLADPQIRNTIVADSGQLAFAPNARDLLVTLYSGYVQETRTMIPDRLQRVAFTTNVMRVADVANQLTESEDAGYKGDREMGVCEMQAVIVRAQRDRDAKRAELVLVDSAVARSVSPRHGGRLGEWYCRAIDAVKNAARSLRPAPATAHGAAAAQQSAARDTNTPKPRVSGAQDTNAPKPGVSGARPSVPPMILPPGQTPGTFRRGGTRVQQPVTPEVRAASLQLEIESAERRINQYEVEIHKKFAISLACLVFALLGPPIALRFPRSGVGLTIGVSIGVFAIYYVGLIAGEKLADKLIVSPVIAMWAANALLAIIGVALAATMGNRGASARGGGFSELFDRLLVWRRRPA